MLISEFVMPFWRILGIHTWMMSPRNEKISALKNCTLCASTIGAARLIHFFDRSGSTVALGAA